MKKLFFILMFLIFITASCSNNKQKSNEHTTVQSADSVKETEKAHDLQDTSIGYYNAKYEFSFDGQKYYFITKENSCLIVDKNDKIIIPEHDLIAFPGQTYPNMVEVSKNGKFGLYSFPDGKQILPTEYDEFYPVFDNKVLAYYKKGNTYGFIKKDNNIPDSELKEYTKSPAENGTVAKWNFKSPSERFVYFSGDQLYDDRYVLPSFFRNIVDDLSGGTAGEEDYSDYDVQFLTSANINGKNVYFIEVSRLLNFTNEIKCVFCSKNGLFKFFDKNTDYDYGRAGFDPIFEYKIVDDSIFRIKLVNNYYYFEINEDSIMSLTSNRKFPFTKYEDIDESFFTGLFLSEPEFDDENGYFITVKHHLSIDDLDIMRNEIFADYGYIFKSDKWKKYFGNKDWYKPRFDNVDNMLSEREKRNIDVIISEKQKMKNNPEKYLKTEKVSYNTAG